MLTFYVVCAVMGSAILVCQLVLMLVGAGGDHDLAGHDFGGHDFGGHDAGGHDAAHGDAHDSSWFFKLVTFRAMVAALAFFGFGGWAADAGGVSSYTAFVSAVGVGAVAMVVVAWLMRVMQSLQSEGTARIEWAVGMPGSVYLSIPGHREGAGKVTVRMRNRAVEYQAMTSGDALPTGAPVVVTDVVGPGTVEVAAAADRAGGGFEEGRRNDA